LSYFIPIEKEIEMSEKEIERSVPSTRFASLGTRIAALLSLTLLSLLFSSGASALPSFMRQTGLECGVCHTVYPQLTPFGRKFKLRGYTLSTPKPDDAPFFDKIPIAALLQVSRTATRNTRTAGATDDNFPRDRETFIQAAGLYYGGKITDRSGALVQYNYDGIERKWAMEMFDARYADSTTLGRELVYGVTLNNNPTISDIYNSTPVWAFPHTGSVSVMCAWRARWAASGSMVCGTTCFMRSSTSIARRIPVCSVPCRRASRWTTWWTGPRRIGAWLCSGKRGPTASKSAPTGW
jgi:hypothetical protein